ncbi:MAG: PEGA domain-containing protein [Myxococcota bacterium]|nr:PEGA domain-containing protein [Myxococcota bacterium]
MLLWGTLLLGCAKQAQLQIETHPMNSVVLINGLPACYDSPCQTSLQPGVYQIDVQAEHFQSFSTELSLRSDRVLSVQLQPKGGWISIETQPANALLILDQKMLGHAPVSDQVTTAGTHTLLVRDACYREIRKEISVKDGEHISLQLSLEPILTQLEVSATNLDGDPLAATIILDGHQYGQTPQTISVPICSQSLLLYHEGIQAAADISLSKDASNRVSLALAPISDQNLSDGLLGFIPPTCRKDDEVDERCVKEWFLRKKQEVDARKQEHFHHEGCQH